MDHRRVLCSLGRRLSRIRTISFVLVGTFFIFVGQVVLITVHLGNDQNNSHKDVDDDGKRLHQYPSWLSSFSSSSISSSSSSSTTPLKNSIVRPRTRSWQIDPPVWEKDVYKFIQKSNRIPILRVPTTTSTTAAEAAPTSLSSALSTALTSTTTSKTITAMNSMTSKKEPSSNGQKHMQMQSSVTAPKGTTGKKRKRRRNRRVKPWDPGENAMTLANPLPLKINTPIFVPSLPKSGTTSIWQYFKCGGHPASHQWVKKEEEVIYSNNSNTNYNSTATKSIQIQSGQCIWDNVNAGLPPFQNCGDYSIYTDTGFALYTQTGGSVCYYPSVDALQEIYDAYPNATFLMVIRNATEWYTSMSTWGDGSLLDRWRPCNATGWPGWNATAQDFIHFYDWHTNNIRRFVAQHPSIHYIEVELESAETGDVLERKVGIPASCWGKCTPASKFCKRVIPPATTATTTIAAVETNLNTTTTASSK